MEAVVKLEDNTVCHGCLSEDRQLNSLGDNLELFSLLTGNERCLGYSANDVKFCWECIGRLRKCRIFQLQLMQAQNSLMQMLYGMGAPQSLSNLATKIISETEIKFTETPNNETIQSIDKTIKIKTEKLYDEKLHKKTEVEIDRVNVICDDHNELNIKNDELDIKNDVLDVKNDELDVKDVELDIKNDGLDDDDFYQDDFEDYKNESLILANEKKLKRNKRKVECFRQWKEKYRNIYKQNAEEITQEKDWGNINDYFTLHKFDEKQLEEHVLVNERKFTDPKKYKHFCYSCKFGYLSLRDYRRHNDLNHLKSKSYKCTVCKKVSKSHEDFSDHWREHSIIAQCKICNKYMKTHGMKQHLKMLHSDRYACKPCNLTFQSLKAFGIHYRATHMNYTCDHCNMKFKCKIRLARHIKINHMPIHCKVCNRTLSNERTYKNHCTVVHPETVNKEVAPELRFCVECDKQFPSAAAYTKHLQDSVRHTNKRPKKAVCPECGKVFHKKTNMTNHYNLYHLKKTNNYCQICDKYYARASGLRKHYNQVHLKLKMPRNVICDICGRYFTTKRIMLNHRATHTGERAHSCMYCSATFIQKYAMQTHMKTQHKHYT